MIRQAPFLPITGRQPANFSLPKQRCSREITRVTEPLCPWNALEGEGD